MTDQIMIVVAGTTGTGKSAISALIKKALAEHGLNAQIIDQDQIILSDADMKDRLVAIRDKSPERVLVIEQIQLNREAMSLDTNLAHHRNQMMRDQSFRRKG